ncbi:MAG: hypothetical protein KJ579_08515 [Verrucomicrobia bacterium]|nr:hypothetical protein [Verrucomicrobiota bacterium]
MKTKHSTGIMEKIAGVLCAIMAILGLMAPMQAFASWESHANEQEYRAPVVFWKDVDFNGTVRVGGTTLDATAAQINGVCTNFDGTTLTLPAFFTAGAAGTSEVATATATSTDHAVRQTTLVLASVPVIMPAVGSGTNAIGSVKLFTFPQGRILIHGVTASGLTIATNQQLVVGSGGDVSLGTTAVATSTTNLLDSTAVNLMAAASIDVITNRVGGALAASAQFDGTTTAVPIYLNHLIDDGDMTALGTNRVSGTVILTWSFLGDY